MTDPELKAKFIGRFQERRFDHYARQEFMTPGVEEVLQLIGERCAPHGARILEVAPGKGEAACRLAERHGARVLGVDLMPMFARYATRKARARRVADLVSIALGDGARLPVASGVFDGAYCTGSPQIAGGDACLGEMHRALKPGGWLAVSDWVWRARPVPPEVVPPAVRVEQFMLLEEYATWLRDAGFEIVLAQTLPPQVWYGYYGPMLEAIEDVRRAHPHDPEAQRWADDAYANEPRLWYETAARDYWSYAAFLARKR